MTCTCVRVSLTRTFTDYQQNFFCRLWTEAVHNVSSSSSSWTREQRTQRRSLKQTYSKMPSCRDSVGRELWNWLRRAACLEPSFTLWYLRWPRVGCIAPVTDRFLPWVNNGIISLPSRSGLLVGLRCLVTPDFASSRRRAADGISVLWAAVLDLCSRDRRMTLCSAWE
jgi:hypothetical protein